MWGGGQMASAKFCYVKKYNNTILLLVGGESVTEEEFL